MKTKLSKQTVITALYKFISQRSGIQYYNYGERTSFMSDYRRILRDGRDARLLLRAVDLRDSITAEHIIAASERAFSGRLTLKARADGAVAVDYTTGQYFPTEYRAAACAVLASVLWGYFRANMPQAKGVKHASGFGVFRATHETESYDGLSGGDWIRRAARREFGRGIAGRWFN